MFLEVELRSAYGSLSKPDKRDYEEICKIIERQVKAETGWKVLTRINREDEEEK